VLLKDIVMGLQKTRFSLPKKLPQYALAVFLVLGYFVAEAAVFWYIKDSLYMWLTFFLVTALFSNLLAKQIVAFIRHS